MALTACTASTHTYSSGEIAKFTSIKTSYGITDQSHFETTGYFTCKTSGMYLFSVLLSYKGDYDGYSYMQKNTVVLITVVSIYQTGTNHRPTVDHHTGSATAVVHLNVGDTLNVRVGSSSYKLVSGESCFTVLKIK